MNTVEQEKAFQKSEVPFTIHYPFIIRLLIEKEYEELLKQIPHNYKDVSYYDKEYGEAVKCTIDTLAETEEQIQAICDIYPLYEVISIYNSISDDELESELFEYMTSDYSENEETITVEIEDIQNFAKYVYEKYKNTDEYNRKRIENMCRYYSSYVYDLNTNRFETVRFGEHFKTIRQFLIDYFLDNPNLITTGEKSALEHNAFPKTLYEKSDKYIADNIVLKGTANNEKNYTFKNTYYFK